MIFWSFQEVPRLLFPADKDAAEAAMYSTIHRQIGTTVPTRRLVDFPASRHYFMGMASWKCSEAKHASHSRIDRTRMQAWRTHVWYHSTTMQCMVCQKAGILNSLDESRSSCMTEEKHLKNSILLPLENNEYLLARPLLEIFPCRNLLKKPTH
jgi:hypothetical protein